MTEQHQTAPQPQQPQYPTKHQARPEWHPQPMPPSQHPKKATGERTLKRIDMMKTLISAFAAIVEVFFLIGIISTFGSGELVLPILGLLVTPILAVIPYSLLSMWEIMEKRELREQGIYGGQSRSR